MPALTDRSLTSSWTFFVTFDYITFEIYESLKIKFKLVQFNDTRGAFTDTLFKLQSHQNCSSSAQEYTQHVSYFSYLHCYRSIDIHNNYITNTPSKLYARTSRHTLTLDLCRLAFDISGFAYELITFVYTLLVSRIHFFHCIPWSVLAIIVPLRSARQHSDKNYTNPSKLRCYQFWRTNQSMSNWQQQHKCTMIQIRAVLLTVSQLQVH